MTVSEEDRLIDQRLKVEAKLKKYTHTPEECKNLIRRLVKKHGISKVIAGSGLSPRTVTQIQSRGFQLSNFRIEVINEIFDD